MKKILVVIALMLSFLVGNVADKYNSLGTESYKNGNYNKALDIRKQILGEKHPDTALSYNNISSIYYGLGDYNKFYENAKKAYEIYNLNKDKSFQILSSSQKKYFLDKNKKIYTKFTFFRLYDITIAR